MNEKDAMEFINRIYANRVAGKGMTEGERKSLRSVMFMPDGRTPKCLHCGQAMRNAKDRTTRKVSPYLWKCGCKGWPKGIVLSVG